MNITKTLFNELAVTLAAGEVFTAPQLLTVVSAATGAWKSTYASLGTISGLGKVMNSQLVLQVARDPTDPEDTYAADAALIQVGIHYEVDSMGSRQMTVK